MESAEPWRFASPDEEGRRLLRAAMEKLGLSARAHDRILRVARTIADLEVSDSVRTPHLAEAIQYRSPDRPRWRGGEKTVVWPDPALCRSIRYVCERVASLGKSTQSTQDRAEYMHGGAIMVEWLFPQTRWLILGSLFSRPGQELHFSELIRLAGGGSAAVQRELRHFMESGFPTRAQVGKQVRYRANPSHALHRELRSLVLKTVGRHPHRPHRSSPAGEGAREEPHAWLRPIHPDFLL
jgi:hypothetical protein